MFRICLLIALSSLLANAADPPVIATFSIIGRDAKTGEIGVAVQSKFVAVGSVVPHAKAGVGAVATQAWANYTYGERGLKLLSEGKSAQQAIDAMTTTDKRKASRQVGILHADGTGATFTGEKCNAWAGGKVGKDCVAQGNIIAGEAVVTQMIAAFEASAGGELPLAERLIAALAAGQEAGGDKRGRQSAALLVVRKGWGYGGDNDRFRDLRVDDHETPIKELARVYQIHRKIFKRPTAAFDFE